MKLLNAKRTSRRLEKALYITLIPVLLLGSYLWWRPNKAHAQTDTFTSSGTWSTPGGVTSATVEIWGAGGGGSNSTSAAAGGGGGGGGYAKRVITPSGNYSVVMGADGGPAADGSPTYITVSGEVAVVAASGFPGSNGSAVGTGGAPGIGTSSVGTTEFNGGNAANGTAGSGSQAGGGGGSGSAGTGGGSHGRFRRYVYTNLVTIC